MAIRMSKGASFAFALLYLCAMAVGVWGYQAITASISVRGVFPSGVFMARAPLYTGLGIVLCSFGALGSIGFLVSSPGENERFVIHAVGLLGVVTVGLAVLGVVAH